MIQAAECCICQEQDSLNNSQTSRSRSGSPNSEGIGAASPFYYLLNLIVYEQQESLCHSSLLIWSSIFHRCCACVRWFRKIIVWLWFRELEGCCIVQNNSLAFVRGSEMDNKTLQNTNRRVSSWRRRELGFLLLYALCFYFFMIRRSLHLSRGTSIFRFSISYSFLYC